MKTRFVTVCLLVVCGASLPFLTGCILLPVVAVGFGGVKAVQALSKSTTEVHFDTPSIEDTNALAGINKLALWPEAKGSGQGYTLVSVPLVAERLSDKLDVVSSLTVLQVMQSNSIPPAFADMTTKEQREACNLIAE